MFLESFCNFEYHAKDRRDVEFELLTLFKMIISEKNASLSLTKKRALFCFHLVVVVVERAIKTQGKFLFISVLTFAYFYGFEPVPHWIQEYPNSVALSTVDMDPRDTMPCKVSSF